MLDESGIPAVETWRCQDCGVFVNPQNGEAHWCCEEDRIVAFAVSRLDAAFEDMQRTCARQVRGLLRSPQAGES
jgi:hypothetical protein